MRRPVVTRWWVADKETTKDYLGQAAGFPGDVTLDEGELRMTFSGSRWKFSSTRFHVVSPDRRGTRLHLLMSINNDGDFGTTRGKIATRNVYSETQVLQSGAEKDGAISWIDVNSFKTMAVPDGLLPYRCRRSALVVTSLGFRGATELVFQKSS